MFLPEYPPSIARKPILTAIDPKTRPSDLARPGHIFPLRARDGGVLIRAGQTEAAVDLAAAAGLIPAGVICEIMKEDGTMARVPDLIEFAEHHDIKMITVADLIRYRLRTERFIRKVGETSLPTRHGDFRMIVFESILDQQIAYRAGSRQYRKWRRRPGARADALPDRSCLRFTRLSAVMNKWIARMQMIAKAGRGVLLYLHEMGRSRCGGGLLEFHGKHGADSNETIGLRGEQREYGIGAQILASLNIRTMRILTNHPRKLVALEAYGLKITAQVPLGSVNSGTVA